jgi:hypothetical protein
MNIINCIILVTLITLPQVLIGQADSEKVFNGESLSFTSNINNYCVLDYLDQSVSILHETKKILDVKFQQSKQYNSTHYIDRIVLYLPMNSQGIKQHSTCLDTLKGGFFQYALPKNASTFDVRALKQLYPNIYTKPYGYNIKSEISLIAKSTNNYQLIFQNFKLIVYTGSDEIEIDLDKYFDLIHSKSEFLVPFSDIENLLSIINESVLEGFNYIQLKKMKP